MKFHLLLKGILLLCTLTAASTAQAATSFNDSTFAQSDWQTFTIGTHGNPPAVVSITPTASGGNSGSYMQMSVTQNAATTSYSSYAGMVSAPLTYNPAVNGSITQLQVSVDLKGFSLSGSSLVQFFAVQNGSYYNFNTPYMALAGTSDWTTYSGTINALTLASAYGVKSDGTAAPGLNISATALPIEFGIGVGEISATTFSNTFGIDNFSVAVGSAPEAPTGTLLLLGGTVFLSGCLLRKKPSLIVSISAKI